MLENLEKEFFTPVDKATLYRIRNQIKKELWSNPRIRDWLQENFSESNPQYNRWLKENYPGLTNKRPYSILEGVYAWIPNSFQQPMVEFIMDQGLKSAKNVQLIYTEIVFEYTVKGKNPEEAVRLTDQIFEDLHSFGWALSSPAFKHIFTTSKRLLAIINAFEMAATFSAKFKEDSKYLTGGQYFLLVIKDYRKILFDTFLGLVEKNCGLIKENVKDAQDAPYNLGLVPEKNLQLLDKSVSKFKQGIDELFKRLESLISLTKDSTLDEDYRLVISEESLNEFEKMKTLYKKTLEMYNSYYSKEFASIKVK